MPEDIPWHQLTPVQQEGLTPEVWEGYTADERRALVSTTCIAEGCGQPRALEGASFYCQQHLEQANRDYVLPETYHEHQEPE
jgi:hypothetical protein